MTKMKVNQIIKNSFITALIVYSTAIQGQVTEQDCVTFGDQYYTSAQGAQIPSACTDIYKANASIKAIDQTESASFKIHGHDRILFVSTFDNALTPPAYKKHIIAGEKTELAEILALEINETDKMVTVLINSPRSIMTYKLDIGGRIYPHKTLRLDDLSTASNVSLDSVNQQVIAIHQTASKLTFYKQAACIHGRKEAFSTEIQRSLGGPLTKLSEPIDACVSSSQNKLYVYDKLTRQVHAFPTTASGNVSPSLSLNVNLDASQEIQKLDCHEGNQKLKLTDQNGIVISVNY